MTQLALPLAPSSPYYSDDAPSLTTESNDDLVHLAAHPRCRMLTRREAIHVLRWRLANSKGVGPRAKPPKRLHDQIHQLGVLLDAAAHIHDFDHLPTSRNP